MKIDLKILDSRITEEMLKPKTAGSAGIDLYASNGGADCLIEMYPGEVIMMGAGMAIHINNPGYAAVILPRSGLGHDGLVLGNLTGLIDSDYQGEIKMSLWNRSGDYMKIKPLQRVAQLVIIPVMVPQFNLVELFSETNRGSNGFGSTGV